MHGTTDAIDKYQQFWASLKSKAPTIIKRTIGRIPNYLSKSGDIFDYDEGCRTIRNDVLARAFADGKPGFEYKERPECAALFIEEKVVKLRKRGDKR